VLFSVTEDVRVALGGESVRSRTTGTVEEGDRERGAAAVAPASFQPEATP
jgi:hypothetical protein